MCSDIIFFITSQIQDCFLWLDGKYTAELKLFYKENLWIDVESRSAPPTCVIYFFN